MPITPFMGVRISWLMLARNCGLHLVREFGPLLGLQQFGIGQLKIARAQRHLLAESAGEMPEPPHPQSIPCARDGHDGDHAQEREPDRLIEVRLEGEAKARAGVAPDSIIVAGDHAKGVGPRRKPGVVGGPAVPRIDPALVEAVESIPERASAAAPGGSAPCSEIPTAARPGATCAPSLSASGTPSTATCSMCTRWRKGIRSNVRGIHPHDAANARKPEHAVLRAKAGGGIAAVEFGCAQAIGETINVKLRRRGSRRPPRRPAHRAIRTPDPCWS